MPKIVSEADRLVTRNRYLENRIVSVHSELISIKIFAENGDCNSILSILEKYNLNKKLEY